MAVQLDPDAPLAAFGLGMALGQGPGREEKEAGVASLKYAINLDPKVR